MERRLDINFQFDSPDGIVNAFANYFHSICRVFILLFWANQSNPFQNALCPISVSIVQNTTVNLRPRCRVMFYRSNAAPTFLKQNQIIEN